MKLPKLYNYEIIKNTLEIHKNKYLRLIEISHLTGLNYVQVENVIHASWLLGWVSRIENPIHNNGLGENKFEVKRTAYKIKRLESWNGLMPLAKQVRRKRKEKKNEK